jgi:hypothetical protein
VCHARVWIGIPTVRLVSRGNSAVKFFDLIHQLHNEEGLTCWHTAQYTIQCWSAHTLSATDGLTRSYIFKPELQNCEPIDLSRFVVDLRERHLEYWTPSRISCFETHPREYNSKRQRRSTYHQWCALPTRRALVTHSPSILFTWDQIHVFQPSLVMSFAVQFVSGFVFTPYVQRQRHGIEWTPTPVACVILLMSKMSSIYFSIAPIPT